MVVYIQEFFETLLGVALPAWFYNTLGLLICMNIVRGMLQLAFPKLSKHTDIIMLVAVLGYIVYEIILGVK